jgi:hypothetical protein
MTTSPEESAEVGSWNLFLDDERWPTWDLGRPEIARFPSEAMEAIMLLGVPKLLSLDHDLGINPENGHLHPNGAAFLWMLIDAHIEGLIDASKIETVIMHSHNPVGATNMAGIWNGFAASELKKEDGSFVTAIIRRYSKDAKPIGAK